MMGPRVFVLPVLTLAAVASVAVGLACGSRTSLSGSGVAAEQTRAVPPFTSVELAGTNVVAIHVGAHQSVVVHADRNLLDRVTTRVRSGRLVIANRPGSWTGKSRMSVEIRMPALTGLRLSGAGVIAVDGLNAPSLAVSIPGSGNISVSGSAHLLDVTVDGSGNAALGALTVREARAVLGGSGTITVRATSSLDASVSGSGAIFYAGHPRSLTSSVTGSGTILPAWGS